MAQLAKALEHNFVYDGIYAKHRQRNHGRATGHLSQHRFLGYIQTHDQVGNRAVGDRISDLAGFERAKIAAAIYLLSPFVPMLFQGEEWASSAPFQYFANHEDRELARLVAEGRRREFAAFGWSPESIPNPEDRKTFERSKLKWDEVNQGQHAAMLQWYRSLIALRRSTPCLNDGTPGNVLVSFDEGQKWLRMERGITTLIANLDVSERVFPAKDCRLELASRSEIHMENSAIRLPPDSVVVLVKATL